VFLRSADYETFHGNLLMDVTDPSRAIVAWCEGLLLPQEAARCADDKGRWHGIGSLGRAAPCYGKLPLDKAGIKPRASNDEIWDGTPSLPTPRS
jgi:hypothetical protein